MSTILSAPITIQSLFLFIFSHMQRVYCILYNVYIKVPLYLTYEVTKLTLKPIP